MADIYTIAYFDEDEQLIFYDTFSANSEEEANKRFDEVIKYEKSQPKHLQCNKGQYELFKAIRGEVVGDDL